jgi:hypothetical protein
MDPVSLDPEHGERGRNNSPVWLNHQPTERGIRMAKKAKSFEQYLVEYIATATVEQTQTALNFFTAIASQKIAASAPAAAAKPAKTTKPAKPAAVAPATTSSVTLSAAA